MERQEEHQTSNHVDVETVMIFMRRAEWSVKCNAKKIAFFS